MVATLLQGPWSEWVHPTLFYLLCLQVPITRPDGDVELADAGHNFKVPQCSSCGGDRLKPDVVFFGDSVPKDRVDRALSAAQSADLVLVIGSSLMVWSAFRLVKAAKEAGAKLAIVNVGLTRADDMADLKVCSNRV